MEDSNRTLKFPRTARQVYGHDIKFDHPVDKWEVIVAALALFVLGIMVGVLIA